MSDRRPEKPSYRDGDAPIYEEAVDEYLTLVNGPTRVIGGGFISPPVDEDSADLIAAVRAGVESGTIKGEVEWRCIGEGNQCGPHSFLWRDQTHDRCGNRLIIGPVSDGGSET